MLCSQTSRSYGKANRCQRSAHLSLSYRPEKTGMFWSKRRGLVCVCVFVRKVCVCVCVCVGEGEEGEGGYSLSPFYWWTLLNSCKRATVTTRSSFPPAPAEAECFSLYFSQFPSPFLSHSQKWLDLTRDLEVLLWCSVYYWWEGHLVLILGGSYYFLIPFFVLLFCTGYILNCTLSSEAQFHDTVIPHKMMS